MGAGVEKQVDAMHVIIAALKTLKDAPHDLRAMTKLLDLATAWNEMQEQARREDVEEKQSECKPVSEINEMRRNVILKDLQIEQLEVRIKAWDWRYRDRDAEARHKERQLLRQLQQGKARETALQKIIDDGKDEMATMHLFKERTCEALGKGLRKQFALKKEVDDGKRQMQEMVREIADILYGSISDVAKLNGIHRFVKKHSA